MLKFHRALLAGVSAAFLLTLTFGQSLRADELSWVTDYEAAKAQAKAENKQVFAFFTGSDWCGWCKKLQGEVFEKDEFKAAAPKNFIFLELDFPREKKLPEALTTQNKKLAEEFTIVGYPTVILIDPEGKEVASTGYKAGGPVEYLKHLDDLESTYKALVQWKADAAKAAGVDKAKLLDQIVDGYKKLNNKSDDVIAFSKEIVSLDADNKAGLKNKHAFLLILAEAASLQKAKKIDEALALYDKAITLPDLTGKQKFEIYEKKAMALAPRKDYAAIVECFKKAIEADPENPNVKGAEANIKNMSRIVDAQKKVADLSAQAAKAEGIERAKLLVQLLEAQDELASSGMIANPKETEKIQDEITKLDPEDTLGYKKMGDVKKELAKAYKLVQAKRVDDAKVAYEKILKAPDLTDAQQQEAHYHLGVCSLMAKDLAKGIEYFKTALEDDPEGPRAKMLQNVIPGLEEKLAQEKAGGVKTEASSPEVKKDAKPAASKPAAGVNVKKAGDVAETK